MQRLVIKNSSWIPASYRNIIREQIKEQGTRVSFRLSKVEKRAMWVKPFMWTSDFAEKSISVTEGDITGPWKNTVTPYLKGIMDLADMPGVEKIIICKAVQTGGTSAVNNCIIKRREYTNGNALVVYPDEKAAIKGLNKITKIFNESPRLKKLMTGSPQDETDHQLRLKKSKIVAGWANSPQSLASDSYMDVVIEEVDKYKETASKKETSSIALAEARTTVYRRRGKARIWMLSTPTVEQAPIWQAFINEAQVIFDFWVKCPECGRDQIMIFDQIKWNGGRNANPEEIEAHSLAWYECKFCQAHWDDDLRDGAVRAGDWLSRGKIKLTISAYIKAYKPKKVGLHLPAWVSYFVSLSRSAAVFIRGIFDRVEYKNFCNNFAAEPSKNIAVASEADDIRKCIVDLPAHTVPQDAVALTAGIDVQKHGFYFVVRAWATDYTSWLIDYGHLGTWEDVDHLLWAKKYPVQGSGRVMDIWRAAIDIGGGKYKDISSTEETQLWLQSRMTTRLGTCRVWGTKGSSHPLATKMKIGNPLLRTPSGKALTAGIRIISLNTDALKDLFIGEGGRISKAAERLEGGAYLHAATDESYISQITAEHKQIDDKGVETWVEKRKGADNHYLDCECMASIVADWEWPGGGVNLLRPIQQQTRPSRQETREPVAVGADYWS